MLDMLLEQFKDKPTFIALITVYARQIQDLENVFVDFAEKQNLAAATGAYLDVIGSVAGIVRGGRDDDAYRASIEIVIAQRADGATVNDIITLVGAHVKTYTKWVVATLPEFVDSDTAAQKLLLLNNLVAAGVGTTLLEPSSDLAHAWIVGGAGANSVGNGLIGHVIG